MKDWRKKLDGLERARADHFGKKWVTWKFNKCLCN